MKKLAQSALSTGSGTLLYTVPAGYQTDMNDVNIANTASTAISCSIHLVPSGGAVGTSNMLFPATSIPANTLIQWTGVSHLLAGDFIQGIGSASGLTVSITGDQKRQGI